MTSSKLEVLTPANCQIIFIDHQPQMAFGVQSIDRQVLKNNTVALAKASPVTPTRSCWTCSRARTFWSVPP